MTTNRAHIVSHSPNHRRTGTDPVWTDTVLNEFNAYGTLAPFTGASRWYAAVGGSIDFIHLGLGVAPTGGSVAFQVNMNGSSIGTLSLAAGTFAGTITPTAGVFNAGTFFTIDQTSGGTSLGAKHLVVQFWGYYR